MYLTASYFSIFSEYVSILLFICLPVVVLSAALAIWLHYRQRKRRLIQESLNGDREAVTFSIAAKASRSIAESPLAPEDKLGLIRECRKQLRKSKAKYMALKSDFTGVLKNIASSRINGNLLTENDRHMDSLNDKIAAYEKQITDLQNKLEVLETVIPVQDERYFLRQALREKDNEIARLKEAFNKTVGNGNRVPDRTEQNDKIAELELQNKLELLKKENAELNKKINEKDEELVEKKQLLESIYKELKSPAINKTRGIAEQSLS